MLMVLDLGPHFENHCLRGTLYKSTWELFTAAQSCNTENSGNNIHALNHTEEGETESFSRMQ